MTTASYTKSCSYYLVLILSLGRPGVAFPAETAPAAQEAAPQASDAAKTTKSKPKPKPKAEEKPAAKPDWAAPPPGSESATPAKSGAAPTSAPAAAAKPEASATPAAAAPVTAATPTPNTPAPDLVEECPSNPPFAPDWPRADTYKGMPFQPGEEARFILKYGAVRVHVGYGFLRVAPPTRHMMPVGKKDGKVVTDGRWHRVFSAEAYTGDWYKMIFAGHDKMQAFSRPWDFGITKFYISQNEEKPFVRRFHAEKWLDFDHVNCAVHERSVDHRKKKETISEHFLQPGADDAMGAVYKLRTFKWELNKTERILVYTSEKNWWLEATPIAEETLKTEVGTFRTHKLQVKTYLGKELQQKGKLFVWIAADHPNHPMVRVEGEVTFGSIYLELDRFTPGA